MTTTTMLLAPALSPLTSNLGLLGSAIRDYARSLQQNGAKVTIVIAIDSKAQPNRLGLARRLQPVTIEGKSFVVHEGSIEGGHIQLLAIAKPDSDSAPSATDAFKTALTIAAIPHSLQVWPATQDALPYSESLSPAPIAIVHVNEARVGFHFVEEGLQNAKLLILPSPGIAAKVRGAKDSKLAPYAEKLFGIAPGYDAREWNPSRDSMLTERLDPPTAVNKAAAKAALQKELGLEEKSVPVLGVISKITALQRSVAEELLGLDLQIVGVDAGPSIESLASRSPKQVACPTLSSDREKRQLRHRILAAADFVLMPSKMQPTSQLFPSRYGTAVIARNKGEFADRLVNFDVRSQSGSGFLYEEEHEVVASVEQAIAAWKAGEDTRNSLIERNLQLDLSWETVALQIEELLQRVQ